MSEVPLMGTRLGLIYMVSPTIGRFGCVGFRSVSYIGILLRLIQPRNRRRRVMPHDLLLTSRHVILLCHAVLSRLAVLRQLQGRLLQAG